MLSHLHVEANKRISKSHTLVAPFNVVIIYDMSVCTWQSRWQLEQVILCLLAVFFCSSEMKQATDPLPLLFSTKSCCLVAVKHDRCIINLSICCYGCIYMYMYHCLKTNFFFKNAIEKFCWVHVFTVTCH